MKVVIGKGKDQKVYDTNEVPIMLVLTPEEKALIEKMALKARKLAMFPDGSMTKEEAQEWIRGVQFCEKCGCQIKEELDSEACWCGVNIKHQPA